MDVYYYKSESANFGDDINSWLWERLIPERLAEPDDTIMMGIGTIIGQKVPGARTKKVFTSGAGYNPDFRMVLGAGWEIVAVRGPLTAALLELPPTAAVTDGAILVHEFPELLTDSSRRSGVFFMPHLSAARAVDWPSVCARAGVQYLDPREEHLSLIKRIGSARLVLADAMHAAIVADALRVPWIPLSTSSEVNTFKWLDWTLSMGVPYQPEVMRAMSPLQFLRNIVGLLTFQRHRLKPDIGLERVLSAHITFAKRKSVWQRLPIRYVGYLMLAMYNALLRFSILEKPIFNVDRNIRILRVLSTRKGFLSDDKIFYQKLNEVRIRLNSV
ncbi:MAG: hypothetical protein FJ184_10095 [Gammaproteobacteria bacterium]|nr:hypothetical protein [Gammaproteobacteria bacterium]